jgi:hypothetical protein
MREANVAQKEMMKGIDIDELQDIRDDMEEMMYEAKEINEAMNRVGGLEIDEAELEAELKELDNEYFVEHLNPTKQKQADAPSYLSELSKPKQTN